MKMVELVSLSFVVLALIIGIIVSYPQKIRQFRSFLRKIRDRSIDPPRVPDKIEPPEINFETEGDSPAFYNLDFDGMLRRGSYGTPMNFATFVRDADAHP